MLKMLKVFFLKIESFLQLSLIGIGVGSISETSHLAESEARKSSILKSEIGENINDEDLKHRVSSVAEPVK